MIVKQGMAITHNKIEIEYISEVKLPLYNQFPYGDYLVEKRRKEYQPVIGAFLNKDIRTNGETRYIQYQGCIFPKGTVLEIIVKTDDCKMVTYWKVKECIIL